VNPPWVWSIAAPSTMAWAVGNEAAGPPSSPPGGRPASCFPLQNPNAQGYVPAARSATEEVFPRTSRVDEYRTQKWHGRPPAGTSGSTGEVSGRRRLQVATSSVSVRSLKRCQRGSAYFPTMLCRSGRRVQSTSITGA